MTLVEGKTKKTERQNDRQMSGLPTSYIYYYYLHTHTHTLTHSLTRTYIYSIYAYRGGMLESLLVD